MERESERGIALILVLIVLPLVAIIMTQLEFEVTIGEHLANSTLANQQFKYAIQARVRQMRVRLVRDLKNDQEKAQEGGAYDHYSEDWGPDSEGGSTATMVKKGDEETGDDVTIYTAIQDEAGKFNLNLLRHNDPNRRARAFETFRNVLDYYRDSRFGDFEDNEWDLSDAEAREVGEAILKFLRGEDRDDRVRLTELPQPTADMKQGVFTIEELVFSHRLFRERRLMERFRDPDSNQVIPSLRDFVTIYGDGKVNANTAPIQVLRAMFKEEEGHYRVAEEILHGRGGFLDTDQDEEEKDRARKDREEREERNEEESETLEQGYTTVNDLTQNVEGLKDGSFLRRNDIDIGRDFTVRTSFFSLLVTARRGNFSRQQRLVLERHVNGTITWETEVREADLEDLPDSGAAGEEPAR